MNGKMKRVPVRNRGMAVLSVNGKPQFAQVMFATACIVVSVEPKLPENLDSMLTEALFDCASILNTSPNIIVEDRVGAKTSLVETSAWRLRQCVYDAGNLHLLA